MTGSPADILPTDPVFILRRVNDRRKTPRVDGISDPASSETTPTQRHESMVPPVSPTMSNKPPPTLADPIGSGRSSMSPQEIIAAQRAASRANQRALISAHANEARGLDVVVPDKGTFRSSRQLEAGNEVVRYSYIDDGGETYDISDLLEEEWGRDGNRASPMPGPNSPPGPETTSRAQISTTEIRPSFGSTVETGRGDVLQAAVQRSRGQPEDNLEEQLTRVIQKVKSNAQRTSYNSELSSPTSTIDEVGRSTPTGPIAPIEEIGRTTPKPSHPTYLAPQILTNHVDDSRDPSRVNDYVTTAASVNQIVSRHRQQPSIASVISDLSAPNHFDGENDRSSTPSSSNATPPGSAGAIYLRPVSRASTTPRVPVKYTDDFGMKTLMGLIAARAYTPPPKPRPEVDEVTRILQGERLDVEDLHPDMRDLYVPLQERLDVLDREIDELLAGLLVDPRGSKTETMESKV